MTDPFEDAVRDVLRGTTSTPAELPTYHGAWQRGRRRRIMKRSALAAAGAFVLIAALAVNLGRLPSGTTTQTSDVATGLEAGTPVFAPTSVPTTAPVQTPLGPLPAAGSGAGDQAELEQVPPVLGAGETGQGATGAEPVAEDDPAPAPAATPIPATPVPPAPVQPALTPVPSTSSADTTASDTADSDRTQTDRLPGSEIQAEASQADEQPLADSQGPDPQSSQAPSTGETAQSTGETAPVPADTMAPPIAADSSSAASVDGVDVANDGTPGQPGDPGGPDVPVTAFTTDVGADATLLTGAARGVALPCDLNEDGLADATCELLPDYPCGGPAADVRPGYRAVDADGDGVVDTCAAIGLTTCDTTNDGQGDTPCIIDITGVPGDSSD